jgi:hypothetical protein
LALSVADPLDAKVQRGLGNTYEYIGGILMLKQNFAGALASYKKTEAIREALAQKDPVNENHRFELADAQAQIGNLYAEMALRRGVAPANQLMLCRSSESWLQKALPTLLDKKAKNRMLGEDFEGLTTVTRNVEACRATIAQLSRKADATSN